MDDRGTFHELDPDGLRRASLKELFEREHPEINLVAEFQIGETFPFHGFRFVVQEIGRKAIRIKPVLDASGHVIRAQDETDAEIQELREEVRRLKAKR
jgi:hypothetical protein